MGECRATRGQTLGEGGTNNEVKLPNSTLISFLDNSGSGMWSRNETN